MSDFIEKLRQAEETHRGNPREIQLAQRQVVFARLRQLREQYKLTCDGDLIKKSQKGTK